MIIAHGFARRASARKFCGDDFYRGPLAPAKSGRPKSEVQAELISAMIGLERRSGILTKEGFSEKKAIGAVAGAMRNCFDSQVTRAAIAQHLRRLRGSASE